MKLVFTVSVIALMFLQSAAAQSCAGKPLTEVGGARNAWAMDGGGIAAFAKMNVNLDGYGHAYSPTNFAGGALLHLCNAGKVYLPDGKSYQGSESNATCTGRFMQDFKRIGDSGWQDPAVGAINWYGILGEGTATIHGKKVTSVKPVLQKDGSGFYVSPTSLVDSNVTDLKDQSRYVNPLRVPSAVVPQGLVSRGVAFGSFGVAIDRRKNIAVPFVVGDGGPRIGEGSAALARLVAGKPVTDQLTRKTSSVGQVDTPDVLWVFFGGQPAKYDHTNESKLAADAKQAFEKWGGEARLRDCLSVVPKQ
ncbi:MAG: hypothetical protein LAO76_22510 [Acidobacteriia bacterium]|nr:hypothetical protein [Terriglobia bacterium]